MQPHLLPVAGHGKAGGSNAGSTLWPDHRRGRDGCWEVNRLTPERTRPRRQRERSQARPGFVGTGLVSDSVVRHERPLTCPQEIVTVEGAEAIPFATTTKVLLPLGVDPGIVNWVEELAPGAIDTELQSCDRA